MKHGQGDMEVKDTGAQRESNSGRGRFDLLPYEAMEALAIWSEEGGKKYGDRNWEKGLPISDCINRMIRHAMKAGNGWQDEDHLAAVMWNAAAAITMMKRMPELDDHFAKTVKSIDISFNHDPTLIEKTLMKNETLNFEDALYNILYIFDGTQRVLCNGVSVRPAPGKYTASDLLVRYKHLKINLEEDTDER